MSKKEKYGFYLIKAGTNSIDAIRTCRPTFTLDELRTLIDSRRVDIFSTLDLNDLYDFDSLKLVTCCEGAISGKKQFNEIASFIYGHGSIYGDAILCRGERRPNEAPIVYPFDLSVKWDAVDYFRISQILPAYAEYLYALKDYPTDEDLHDIFGLPLPWDDE